MTSDTRGKRSRSTGAVLAALFVDVPAAVLAQPTATAVAQSVYIPARWQQTGEVH
ncbi:hypothetical protein [Saccharothrix sp. ALI-22-I]|uniref:hypothetical protein n=1 Tax=Saccharothrix sp. ALI-22-I TaxID=1933778 RepID=UPI0015C2F9BB|nr:hypothetical protein [Saccharothrix sp. ALI-22-I]